MRIRHFPMACETVAAIFSSGSEHNFKIASGFPEDAKVRGAFTEGDAVVFVVESREFPDVSPFGEIPARSILIEQRPIARAAAASLQAVQIP